MIHRKLLIISVLKPASKWKSILNPWKTKMPLNSADLKQQSISYQLSREEGVKFIEMTEYAFCVIMISEMNSIMFYGVKILLLVENYKYGLLINKYLESITWH